MSTKAASETSLLEAAVTTVIMDGETRGLAAAGVDGSAGAVPRVMRFIHVCWIVAQ